MNELQTTNNQVKINKYELALVNNDLSKLSEQERLDYVTGLCKSLGLNHLSQPFQYIQFQGKIKLYATKDCTEQLRKIHGVSLKIVKTETVNDCYLVTCKAIDKEGKTDESIGAVSIKGLSGDALCNALMKAETKSKRRVTLSVCGLGILDESEIETLPKEKEIQTKPELKKQIDVKLSQVEKFLVKLGTVSTIEELEEISNSLLNSTKYTTEEMAECQGLIKSKFDELNSGVK